MFGIKHVLLGLLAAGGLSSSAMAASPATATMDVKINIVGACTVTAAELDFGNNGVLANVINQDSSLTVTCSNGLGYNVGISDGANVSSSVRRMKGVTSPNEFITYELYKNSGRTERWGAAGVARQPGTGTGVAQTIPVYGQVTSQSTPTAGAYSDTVAVTVDY